MDRKPVPMNNRPNDKTRTRPGGGTGGTGGGTGGGLGRILVRTLQVLALLVSVVLLLVVGILSLSPGRRALLGIGIDQAGRLLTGELTLQRADWPRLGRLELDGLVWADGAETLLSVDSLRVDCDLGDLFRKDVTVRLIQVDGVRAHLPLIQSHLPAPSAAGEVRSPDAQDSGGAGADSARGIQPAGFPRMGSVPPVPSLAVDRLVLRSAKVILESGETVVLDSLSAAVDLRAGRDVKLDAAIRAWVKGPAAAPDSLPRLPDLGLCWSLRSREEADSLVVALSPLHVAHSTRLAEPRDLTPSGSLRIARGAIAEAARGEPGLPHLSLREFTLIGDLGSWSFDARVAGSEPGWLRLRTDLPEAPSVLFESMPTGAGDLIAAALDTLEARWAREHVPGLVLDVAFDPPNGPGPLAHSKVAARGAIRLPGPSSLAPLFPPQLRVDDLGPIHAEIDARYDGAVSPPSFQARLDLGRTKWLNTALVQAAGTTERIRLDSLVLRLPGLALIGRGEADRRAGDVVLELHLPDAELLRRWDDPVLNEVSLSADARLAVSGEWPLPAVTFALEVSAEAPQATVPTLVVGAAVSPDTLTLDVDLPRGFTSAAQEVESASLRFRGAAYDSLRAVRGRVQLDARMPEMGFGLQGYLRAVNLYSAPSSAPSGTFDGEELRLELAGQDLASTGPWGVRYDAADSVVRVDSLRLSGGLGELDLQAFMRPDSLEADLGFALELDLDRLRPLLPPESQAVLPRAVVLADGRVRTSGSPAAPWTAGELRVGFRDNEQLDALRIRTGLSVGGEGQPPAHLDAGGLSWRQRGILATVVLEDADSVLAVIEALAPSPLPEPRTDSLSVRFEAHQMSLARLQPFLPGGLSLKGRLDADPRVSGMIVPGEAQPVLDLAGAVRLQDLRLGMPDGSWAALGGEVRLAGNTKQPGIEGGFDIEGALIRLPDPPPTLLPAKGDAMLWTTSADVPRDSVAQEKESGPGSEEVSAVSAGDSLSAAPPELAVAIRCPGGLWLRGQGLDVELAGDLMLRVRDGKPALGGELEAVQGTIKQLGHVFELERGQVVFYADEADLDPDLDLVLGVQVSPYVIRIEVTGTANQPQLAFSSEPELSEGDIISTLLFGKPADELDEGQSGLLADRATEIAASYGASKLQERVAKQLGLDVVSISPKSGESETTTLTVGKYLNPKVMVRYEQLLRESSAFFVHLDYLLARQLKVHTQVSQGEASGVELKWERNW